MAVQTDKPPAGVVQVHPFSIAEQVEVHPSEFAVFPSSQASVPKIFESPQIGEQTLGELVLQFHPVSTTQVEEHPSPLAVLPSSHPSFPSQVPFPQFVEHTEKEPGAGRGQTQPASIIQFESQPSPLTELSFEHW